MESSMEEILKKIIQIDKNADSLKKNLEDELKAKLEQVETEIERLKTEIVLGAKEKAKSMKEIELEKATKEAEEIIARGKERALELQQNYKERKATLIPEIFQEII